MAAFAIALVVALVVVVVVTSPKLRRTVHVLRSRRRNGPGY